MNSSVFYVILRHKVLCTTREKQSFLICAKMA